MLRPHVWHGKFELLQLRGRYDTKAIHPDSPKTLCRRMFVTTVIRSRWQAAWTIGIGLCCAHMPAASAAEYVPVVDPAKCAEGLEVEVATKLGHAHDTPHHSACRLMPSDRSKAIMALSFIRPGAEVIGGSDDMGDYDLDVLIVQSRNGAVLSRLHLNKVYASDAWRFSTLGIDTGRYILAPGVRAFGVRASHSSSSRASLGNETTLSLYVQDGKRIRQVLRGLVVSKNGGEWDMQCSGNFFETERAIEIGTSTNKGFADLIVTSTTIDIENRTIKSECKNVRKKPQTNRTTLRYDGKAYIVPKELRGLQ
jgi:hypothetical protein